VVAQFAEPVGVGAHADAFARFVDDFDFDAVAPADASAVWRAFDHIERLAANAKTLLAAKVEASGDWKRAGHRSAAEYLARVGGTTTSAARQALETSKQLATLPATTAAIRAGALSVTQASAVAGAAAARPDAEQRLLAMVTTTNVTELREECLRTKLAADSDPDATHRRIHAQRAVHTYRDAEGGWNCHVRGTAERGAVFEAALARLVDREFEAARAEDRREPREAYAFDALMKLANGAAPAEPNGRPNPRYLAVLRADLSALVRGEVHDGEGPTAAQRIALLWSQPKCSNAACSGTFTHFDHREPWAKTKHTVLSELDRFCPHDHDLKTNRGWSLVEGTGRRTLVPPDDPRHPRNRPAP
jgi:hypothetical protein